MLALLFEVTPRPGHERHYFERAAVLRPLVEANPGLLFLERFRSQSRPGVILSHSLWSDEDSLADWRRNSTHVSAQAAGRNTHFADYRIRIAPVIEHLSNDMSANSVPGRAGLDIAKSMGSPDLVIIVTNGAPFNGVGETFESVSRDDTYLFVSSGEDLPDIDRDLAPNATTDIKFCQVVRDYGMSNRDLAPEDPVADGGQCANQFGSSMNPDIMLAMAIAAAAGLMRGFAGVGSGMLMAAVFCAFVRGRSTRLAIIILMEIIVTAQLLPSVVREINWRVVAPMGLAAALLMPVGTWLLLSLDGEAIGRIVAVVVVVSSLILLSGWRYQGSKPIVATLGVGALSGVLMALTSLGNPPVMIYLLSSPDSAVQPIGPTSPDIFGVTLVALIGVMTVSGLINWGITCNGRCSDPIVHGVGLARQQNVSKVQRNPLPKGCAGYFCCAVACMALCGEIRSGAYLKYGSTFFRSLLNSRTASRSFGLCTLSVLAGLAPKWALPL